MARERRWLEWDSEDLNDFLCDLREDTQTVAIKGKSLEIGHFPTVFLYLSCLPEHRDPVRYFHDA